MKKLYNGVPIYTEERIINEEINIQEALSQFKQLAPVNFIQLETKGRNHMCSTQGWKEPVCERYIFFENDKPIQLDVPQEIMTELGLTESEDIHHPVYVLPEVLKRTPIQLGITIKNKGEIFIQKPLTVNNLEGELNKWLDELKNSREKIKQLNNNLQTAQQEKDQIQRELNNLENKLKRVQGKLLFRFFKSKENRKKIKDLNVSILRLGVQLSSKNRQIDNLNQQLTTANNLIINTQNLLGINNLNNLPPLPHGETLTSLLARPTPQQLQTEQNRANGLNQQLTVANNTIANLQNGKREIERLLKQWTDKFIGKDADQVDEWLKKKDRTITELNSQISSLQAEISTLRSKSIDNYPQGNYFILSLTDQHSSKNPVPYYQIGCQTDGSSGVPYLNKVGLTTRDWLHVAGYNARAIILNSKDKCRPGEFVSFYANPENSFHCCQ